MKKTGYGSIVVAALMGLLFALSAASADAAIYVGEKRCSGDAFEQADGSWKCRAEDGTVTPAPAR